MLIRVEIPIDAPGIDTLLRQAFGRKNEAELVRSLREDGLLTLGVVATDDEGTVVGYVAFSPVSVNGEERQWVGLAPLAVAESLRGQGVAKQLIYEGLDALNEFGYAAAVALGEAKLYQPLGFQQASHYQLACGGPETEPYFWVYPLGEDAVCNVSGKVDYASYFASCR